MVMRLYVVAALVVIVACALASSVPDTQCTISTLHQLQSRVAPLLTDLLEKPFFRYYKLNLWRPCDFWPDDGQCMLRACAVSECEKSEFEAHWCDEPLARIDNAKDPNAFTQWKEQPTPWSIDFEDQDETDMIYIDLSLNQERFTGYKGEGAQRIWRAIYTENCFIGDKDAQECKEKRLFYRLVSGMHASISVHVAYDYLLDETAGTWGRNIPLYMATVGAFPDRLENLYLTYLVTLRAVAKLAPALVQYPYNTKDPAESARIQATMADIADITVQCGPTFDEGAFFGDATLRAEARAHWYNISRILDCTLCEKCRMWGKIRTAGLGAAMKVLFEGGEDRREPPSEPGNELEASVEVAPSVTVQRSEVIALVHMLAKLSDSINMAREMHPADAPEVTVTQPEL